MPTMNEQDKNASIDYILSQGLTKPQTAWGRIAEMTRAMGWRHIFWDTGYSLFFAALTFAVVLFVFAFASENHRYAAAFAETSERACGLFELKQTCRYTIRQITALRVVCYSVVGVVSTVLISLVSARGAYDFLSLFALCLSALLLCAVLSLATMRVSRVKWLTAAFSAAWVFTNIALPTALVGEWERALAGVPIVLSAAVAAICAAAFAWQISRMLSEVEKYASA
jgi:hypothetical protein